MGKTPKAPKGLDGTHVSRNYVVFTTNSRLRTGLPQLFGEGASKRRMRSCRRAHWRLPCWRNSTCGQASNQLLLVGLESAVLIRKLAAQYTGSPRFIPRAPRQAFKQYVRRNAVTRSPAGAVPT